MARKTINIILTSIVLVFILGLMIALEAQTNEKRTRREPAPIDINISTEDMPRLVEIIKTWKMVDELELDEGQLAFFLPKFNKLDKLISNYYGNRNKNIREIKKFLETNASDEKLEDLVLEFRQSEIDFFGQYRETYDELQSKLNIKQKAKFVVFQEEYRRDIGRLLKNLRDLNNLREQRMKHQPVPIEKK